MTDMHSGANQSGEEDRGRTDSERDGLLSALQAERQGRQALERQVAVLEGKISGMAASQPAKEAPKVYTEAELQSAVAKGTISEAQANSIRARQIREEAVAEAKKAVKAEWTETQTTAQVNAELGRYTAALPGLKAEGSPERDKANVAFQRLLGRGYDRNDPRTELLAVEMAFGPVEALEAAKPRGERETHQEIGGGGSGGEGGGSGEGWPKDMPAKNRRYYEEQVAKGRYTRESALKEWKGYVKRRAAA